jgi:putative NADH-flavin reductase
MKIVVLGATGGTGREIVRLGLVLGHQIIAVVREPGRLGIEHPGLSEVVANVFDATSLSRSFEGSDAVISALGLPNVPKGPVSLYSGSARAIIEALRGAPHLPAVFVSSSAHLHSRRLPLLFTVMVQPILLWLLRHSYVDMKRMEALVEASQIDWTIVRAARLTDAPMTGSIQWAVDDVVNGSGWNLSRADLAQFLISCVETGSHLHQKVSVAN